jgi:hypothetical protein
VVVVWVFGCLGGVVVVGVVVVFCFFESNFCCFELLVFSLEGVLGVFNNIAVFGGI